MEDNNAPVVTPPVVPPVVAPVAPVTPPATPEAEQTIPYSRFKEVNDQLKALRAELTTASTTAKTADELQGQVKELTGKLLRGQVAAAVGLPAELADRLRGDDEAALTADATALLALIPKKVAAPNINGDTPNANEPTFTLSQISNSEFYAKNREAIQEAMKNRRIVEG